LATPKVKNEQKEIKEEKACSSKLKLKWSRINFKAIKNNNHTKVHTEELLNNTTIIHNQLQNEFTKLKNRPDSSKKKIDLNNTAMLLQYKNDKVILKNTLTKDKCNPISNNKEKVVVELKKNSSPNKNIEIPTKKDNNKEEHLKKENEVKQPLISGKTGDLVNYVIGRIIGQGAYASVRLAYNKVLGKKVALKVYDKRKLKEPQRQKGIYREIYILGKMNHSNILKLYDAFDTDNHVILATEYIRGKSLHAHIKSQPNRKLEEWEAKRIFKQIVCGIEYCHSRSIVHRDIKLENLLLSEHNEAKVIDFGFSTRMPNNKKIKIFCGTPSYMSPEIVLRKEYTGPPADIWALGVLLYAMLCGTFPFKGKNDKELYRAISTVKISFPEHLSESAISLIRRILQFDPEKRPTASEIVKDPWLTTNEQDKIFTFKEISKTTSQKINLEAYMAYYSDQALPKRTECPPTINNNINIITNITHINFANNQNSSDYSISSSKMASQNLLMKSNVFDISKQSVEDELIGSIIKLGYTADDIKQQMQNENSHIYKLYNRLLEERKLLRGIPPQNKASLSFDVLRSKFKDGLMNTSERESAESNTDPLNQTAPLNENGRHGNDFPISKEV